MKAIILSAIIATAMMTSCRTSSPSASTSSDALTPVSVVPSQPVRLGGGPGLAALPQAQIYRTSTDADALVPVQVNPVDGQLISYPAPSDITGAQMPVVLHDGWLLDRRGISPDTRFISYTYSRYHSLLEAPSTAEIKAAIVPDARVTEIVSLPYKIGEVTTAMADSLISAGLPGCTVTFKLK